MTKEYETLKLENRISLLEGRETKENDRIVRKLKRKLEKLKNSDDEEE